jgi:small GTP-binding protein
MYADDTYKIIIIGDSSVGKTNLLVRFAENEFTDSVQPTIGIDFKTRQVEVEGRHVKLQCWDTAGQERFRAVTMSIYLGARGIMIVYVITNQSSFDSLEGWLAEVRTVLPENTPVLLCGNKCDLDHMRVVRKDVADAFARQNNLALFETSAKDTTNVVAAFEYLAKRVHEVVMNEAARADHGVSPGGRQAPHRPGAPGQRVGTSFVPIAPNRGPGVEPGPGPSNNDQGCPC